MLMEREEVQAKNGVMRGLVDVAGWEKLAPLAQYRASVAIPLLASGALDTSRANQSSVSCFHRPRRNCGFQPAPVPIISRPHE